MKNLLIFTLFCLSIFSCGSKKDDPKPQTFCFAFQITTYANYDAFKAGNSSRVEGKKVCDLTESQAVDYAKSIENTGEPYVVVKTTKL